MAGAAAAQVPAGPWRDAPEFLPLFTPISAPAGTYRTYVSPLALEPALEAARRDPTLADVPGGWAVQRLLPLDAFGTSGGYNRWLLARLYGAARARVARGPRIVQGEVVESWTLVSPYPEPDLRRLNPGTLLIVLRTQPR